MWDLRRFSDHHGNCFVFFKKIISWLHSRACQGSVCAFWSWSVVKWQRRSPECTFMSQVYGYIELDVSILSVNFNQNQEFWAGIWSGINRKLVEIGIRVGIRLLSCPGIGIGVGITDWSESCITDYHDNNCHYYHGWKWKPQDLAKTMLQMVDTCGYATLFV